MVILTYFQEISGGVPSESEVGLSVTNIYDSPLPFVTKSSILDFAVALDASLDINCVYIYFYNNNHHHHP